jgi:hypothetical protein
LQEYAIGAFTMTLDQLFTGSFLLVAPFWLLMIVLPFWRWTERIVKSPWIVIGPVLIYTALVLPNVAGIYATVSNPQLPQIAHLLGEPLGATIGWMHFLAFDLFVARWIYLDSRGNKITAWLVSPILYFVLMIGPVGLLGYLLVRSVYQWLRQPQSSSTSTLMQVE